MHDIEPFYSWRSLYCAEEDENSPFYGREYSEIYFSNAVYNYFVHPQWDEIGSETLYIKILYTDYNHGFSIIELIGEWNDLLYNDIMNLKRNIIDELTQRGISHFILLMDNVLNFHASDDSYYEEWFDDCYDGWIVFMNMRPHVIKELENYNLDYYINYGQNFEEIKWRKINPLNVFQQVNTIMQNRLN
jgi:hypothetical protein